MQFTNLAFVLQVAAIAAAAAVPPQRRFERPPRHAYCIPGTFGCNSRRSEPVAKREPTVEVDVQQSTYCIPGTFGCHSRRTDIQAAQE
ncbi:hypothetical protein PG993_003155 [Apiospora rasikravindrae]|uniref:Uncharacterized protein n=1 Tax=Apiospora rasikravindrae TaxID=990691 RepID=A0ABR1U100_9PEZI